ncbi:MAG: hypothetical protein V3V74_07420 [Nitrosomonadaceae bacterium]
MKNKIRALTLMVLTTIFTVVPLFSVKADCPDTGTPDIHIMYVYTQDALDKFGTVAALEAEVDLAIDEINFAWENSGLTARAQVVRVMPVTYTEVGDLLDSLKAIIPVGLARTTYMDRIDDFTAPLVEIPEDIDAAADEVGADAVIMIHGQSTEEVDFIGLSTIKVEEDDDLGLGPDICRAVILADYLSGSSSYIMAHEFGHACGCSHDIFQNGGTSYGYFPYSTGFVAPPTMPLEFAEYEPDSFGTVMSYADWAENGIIYPYFSDPERLQGTEPMGRPDVCDNVRTLEQTLAFVAAHREDTYSLKPATIAFSATKGGQTADYTVNFTPETAIPADGSIAITYPVGFRFNYPKASTVSNAVTIDGTFTVSVSERTLTLTRNNDGTEVTADEAIAFDLNYIGVAETGDTRYSGNFCFHTYDAEGVEIDYNHAVLGTNITAGSFPEPTHPKSPSYREKRSVSDRLGCLLADMNGTWVALLALGLCVMAVGLRLRKV